MKPLRLGLVGCGDIAGYTALFARLNRRIQLAACCDSNREKAGRFARRHGIPRTFTDYSEMLAEVELEAVYLAVPHHLHAGMMQAAIAAGRHIFVEKPLTSRLDEGREIVRQADEAGVRVGVNYQYRYDSGCHALARAVQSGALGRVYYARANLAWQRGRSYFEQAAWHASLEQSGGGTLITQGSHLLDLLLWALGSRPVTASGLTAQQKFKDVEVEDLALAAVELENGALVQLSSSMAATPEQALSLEVYGEHGTAVYSDRPFPRVRFRGVRVRPERPPVRGIHALQRSLEGFRAWVVDGRPYLTPAGSALPVLAAVEAIYRSAQSGKKEPVDF